MNIVANGSFDFFFLFLVIDREEFLTSSCGGGLGRIEGKLLRLFFFDNLDSKVGSVDLALRFIVGVLEICGVITTVLSSDGSRTSIGFARNVDGNLSLMGIKGFCFSDAADWWARGDYKIFMRAEAYRPLMTG